MSQRELDIVVFGATGFVGRLAAAYLAHAAPAGTRIGLAGRSRERLDAVRAGLGRAAADWSLLAADLHEPETLQAVAVATHVVATTAGPYAPYGLGLVEACVRARTDYCDLAGEVLFIHDSADRYHLQAAADGTRIVHACGVDSIPSDLGVRLLAERAHADDAGELEDTTALVSAFRGGFSGGTLATMRTHLEEIRSFSQRRRIVTDPYALSPDRPQEPDLGEQPDLRGPARDREHQVWLAPFLMAGINARVVRRSNALQHWVYGRRLGYREALAFPAGPRGALTATVTAAATQLLVAAMTARTAQPVLERLLPSPGEGPDAQRRRNGRFAMRIHAHTSNDSRYVARIEGAGDPGYTLSSLMLGESALCLAFDRDQLPSCGGVLTPSTAMATTLANRLRRAGLTLTIERLQRDR